MMEGLPSFGLSAGPSAADATSGVGGAHTGGFYFKQRKQGLEQYVPLALVLGAAWLILKKSK